jgi:hypothetical protein
MTIKRAFTAVSIFACFSVAANTASAWPDFNVPSFNQVVAVVSNPVTYTNPPIPPIVTAPIQAGLADVNNAIESTAVKACEGAISGAASVAVGLACEAAAAAITATCVSEVAPATEGAGAAACAAIPPSYGHGRVRNCDFSGVHGRYG